MWLLFLSIILILLSIILAIYYRYNYKRGQYKNKKPFVLASCGVGAFIAGNTIMFFSAGWLWGVAILIVSWLFVIIIGSGVIYRDKSDERYQAFMLGRVKDVEAIENQHNSELEEFWQLTTPEECANLMIAFLEKLRLTQPKAYLQLNPQRLPQAISDNLKNSIKRAYLAGYMAEKHWISQVDLDSFNIYLGLGLAQEIRITFNEINSNDHSFVPGFVVISKSGRSKVF